MSSTVPSVCLFGASESTSNLGVSALYHATLSQLLDRVPELGVTVFEYRRGSRSRPFEWSGGRRDVQHLGANLSRRVWRGDSLAVMQAAARVPLLPNQGVRALRHASTVLDISGGDSFTDLYGEKRFRTIVAPKHLALAVGTPLLLLPQTYGPFRGAEARRGAVEILLRAACAWARDPWSHAQLQDLLGDRFDPEVHRLGVDVAFGLEPRPPQRPLSEEVERWLADGAGPVVGVNVSGLVSNSEDQGARSFGFRCDYRAAVLGIVRRVLAESDARVALVPHVLAPPTSLESDPAACARVLDALTPAERARVAVLQGPYSANEVKHLIERLAWFCGTRMHATIAALSRGVPCSAIAYSPKFQGVFETCGQSAHVADPTALDTEALVAAVLRSFAARDDARASLAAALPDVRAQLGRQFDHFVGTIRRR